MRLTSMQSICLTSCWYSTPTRAYQLARCWSTITSGVVRTDAHFSPVSLAPGDIFTTTCVCTQSRCRNVWKTRSHCCQRMSRATSMKPSKRQRRMRDLAKAASTAPRTASGVGMVTAPCSLESRSGAVQEMDARGWTSMVRSSETLVLGIPWAQRPAAAAETARDDGPPVVQGQPVEKTPRMIRSVRAANDRRHQAAISLADDQADNVCVKGHKRIAAASCWHASCIVSLAYLRQQLCRCYCVGC